jgi:hypothetical protein
MDNFERELARALERGPAPPGFSARVLARISSERSISRKRPTWRLAFATSLVLAIFAGGLQHDRVERQRETAQGEAARQQVMLALRIAGSKMQLAQHEISATAGRAE